MQSSRSIPKLQSYEAKKVIKVDFQSEPLIPMVMSVSDISVCDTLLFSSADMF